MSFAHIIHRIATDAFFADIIQDQPEMALANAGLSLDPADLELLLTVLRRRADWKDLCSVDSMSPPSLPWPAALFHRQQMSS